MPQKFPTSGDLPPGEHKAMSGDTLGYHIARELLSQSGVLLGPHGMWEGAMVVLSLYVPREFEALRPALGISAFLFHCAGEGTKRSNVTCMGVIPLSAR